MRTSLALTAALAATLVVTACSKKKVDEPEPVIPVEVTAAELGSIERIITAEGILRAKDQSAVMPKISAPVSRFYVNRGDHVRKGQLLAVLENKDLAAGVVDTRGSFEQANATYRNVAHATVPDELVKSKADVDSARQAMEAAKTVVESRSKLFQEGALAKKLVDE
jgi:HlyD family secretion protein